MGTIVIFTQRDGLERIWVPKAEESWWVRFWHGQGIPAATLADYRRWGGFHPRNAEAAGEVMLRPPRRKRPRRAR